MLAKILHGGYLQEILKFACWPNILFPETSTIQPSACIKVIGIAGVVNIFAILDRQNLSRLTHNFSKTRLCPEKTMTQCMYHDLTFTDHIN